MTHPILALQATLVTALAGDAALTAIIGANAVFDAAPKGKRPPYVTVARHDVLPRDGDTTPGNEHRVVLHAWTSEASRKAVLQIADGVIAVAMTATLDDELVVTHRQYERTDTAIDRDTGFARAAISLRFFTEPS
jgi:hypothetical protein